MPNSCKKIMFIDDEPEVVNSLIDVAIELGFETVVYTSGVTALEELPKIVESLTLIISDYNIGDINGLEIRSRMLPKYAYIPFIIYSGFVTKDILKNAINLKVSKFIDKPFDSSKLKNLLIEETKDRTEQIDEKTILRGIFIEEAKELLEDLEEEILAIEQDPHPDHINSIFRLVHTIKGGSGVLDFPEFTKVVHAYEDLLSKIKDKKVTANPHSVSILLKGFDFLSKTLKAISEEKYPKIDVDSWTKVFSNVNDDDIDIIENQAQSHGASKKEEDLIKVPSKILDEFMELSGEITVIRNTVNKLVGNIQKEIKSNKEIGLLAEFLDEMHKINSSMQLKITELRKVSLKNVFRSIPRTVRDLNNALNKQIELNIHGDDLRVDNTLALVLRNSLIHVVRNSADHGIESPSLRKSNGKPETGIITINAYDHNDEVIVELSDDGGGIDTDRVLKSAIEKGLYTPDSAAKLTDNQIRKIIMEPGFSTAATITDVSGRGVGMDMVRNSIESIGGRIEIESTLGIGTKFKFHLPVPKSVTIIRSLLVSIGNSVFNIPQEKITRLLNLELNKADLLIRELEDSRFLELDGKLIPLITLHQDICPDFRIEAKESIEIVILNSEGIKYGLIVDQISDTEEIVVKKIPAQISNYLFKDATFMGDGSVGLILDIDGIAKNKKLDDTSSNDLHSLQKLNDKDGLRKEFGEEYIVFNLSFRGKFAISLDQIYRLEEIDRSKLTSISGQSRVIYRDQIMPIIFTDSKLGSNETMNEVQNLPTIIIRNQEHFYGLVVNKILGIRMINQEIDTNIRSRKEFIGSFGLEDGVITVIDIYKILGLKNPSEQVQRINTTQEKNTENLDLSSGWGLF